MTFNECYYNITVINQWKYTVLSLLLLILNVFVHSPVCAISLQFIHYPLTVYSSGLNTFTTPSVPFSHSIRETKTAAIPRGPIVRRGPLSHCNSAVALCARLSHAHMAAHRFGSDNGVRFCCPGVLSFFIQTCVDSVNDPAPPIAPFVSPSRSFARQRSGSDAHLVAFSHGDTHGVNRYCFRFCVCSLRSGPRLGCDRDTVS